MSIYYNLSMQQKMTIQHDQKLFKTNLKRDKKSFQSTAFQSMEQTKTIIRTLPRTYSIGHPVQSMPQFQLKNKLEDTQTITKKDQSRHQLKQTLQIIALSICDEQNKSKRQVNSKFMRHFYYRGISRVIRHPLLKIPKIVIDLYEHQQLKRIGPSSPPVSFSQGFLPITNCLYYAIQNTIIFIAIQDIMDSTDPSLSSIPYIIHQVRNQVINITQLKGQYLLFPTHKLILIISHPWQLQFYAWQFGNTDKLSNPSDSTSRYIQTKQLGLTPLNFIYQLPIEKVKAIDYSKDGRLFFFDQLGFLHQISPHLSTKFIGYRTGKYTIKNFVNSSHNTFELFTTKHGKFSSILNVASCITQASKYLFPSKIESKVLFVDNKRQLLLSLLKKNIQLLFGNQNQIFVVCYCIKGKSKLLHKFSEQFFIEKYGVHIHGQKNQSFKINSIRPAPSYYENANISVITQSGIQIIMLITQNDAKLVEIIRPPVHRMFEFDISSIMSNVQFPPMEKSQYKVISFLQDEQKTICTVKNKGGILTYLTSNTVYTGAIDINQQANAIDMQIHREGETETKIYKVDENRLIPFMNQNQAEQQHLYISQLTKQILCPPSIYLFQGHQKLQLLTYLRPIDILFTTISLLTTLQSQKSFPSGLTKQKFILKLFMTQSHNFSSVSNSFVNLQELCSMTLQIVVDRQGMYYYSNQTAKQISQILYKTKVNQSGLIINQPTQIHAFDMYEYQRQKSANDHINFIKNQKHYQLKIPPTQIFPYSKIPNKLMHQFKQLLQNLSIQGPNLLLKQKSNNFSYELPQSNKINKKQIILFKINVIIKYLTRLLQPIWNIQLNKIGKITKQTILTKLQFIHKYLQETHSYNTIFDNIGSKQTQFITIQSTNLTSSITHIIQLIHLLQNIPFLPINKKFGQCTMLENQQFQIFMFQAIHKQFQIFIVNKWLSLFPDFVHHNFVRIVRLYGEIQDIYDNKIVIQQLKEKAKFIHFPTYFLDYLRKIRRFTQEDIKQILSLSLQKSKRNTPQGNDFQFVIPERIRQIANSYNKNTDKLSQSDTLQVINILKNKSSQNILTIANKQSLMTYIKTHLPKNDQLQYLLKCISVQYELYRYYLRQLQQNDKIVQNQNNQHILKLFRKTPTSKHLKQNSQTMQLLKLSAIVDEQKLKKLVLLTADYWLMSDYCVTFDVLDELKAILKQICLDYENARNKGYSSIGSYLQRYLLNFAIKSQYSSQILQIICQTIDSYMIQLPSTQGMMISWIQFSYLPQITNKHIWLPQLLIKLGYTPQNIFNIYQISLESLFDHNLPFIHQLIYGFKFLNCYLLCSRYFLQSCQEFAQIVVLQLHALQRNNNIQNKTALGIRKMLDLLVSKPLN